MDLTDLPVTALLRFVQDIVTQGGSQRLFELSSTWAEFNPEQAEWISSLFGVDVADFATKMVDDMEFAAGSE